MNQVTLQFFIHLVPTRKQNLNIIGLNELDNLFIVAILFHLAKLVLCHVFYIVAKYE